MLLHPSIEAIDFQHDSKFAKELTEVFQKVIDYRESLSGDDKTIKKDVIQFADSFLADAFIDTVKKHTNLEVKQLNFSYRPNLLFAVQPMLGTETITNNIFYGHTGQKVNKLTPTTSKELEVISSSFSKEYGKLNETKFKLGKYEKSISCQMYFDLCTAFLSKETLHKDLPRLEAAEIAAIMLHEVGHVLVVVENMSNRYQFVERHNESMNYFNKYSSVDEKLKYSKVCVNRIKKDSNIDNVVKDKLLKVQEGIEELKEKSSKFSLKNIIYDVINIVSLCAFKIIMLAQNELARTFGTIATMDIINTVTKPNVKTSDKLITDKNYYLNERGADEFVSRHGYSGHHAKALDTIFSYGNFGIGTIISPYLKFVRNETLFLILFSNIFVGSSDGFGVYETETKRTERLKQNCVKAFKDANLPAIYIDNYILEYEQVVDIINNKNLRHKATRYNENMEALLRYVLSPVQLINTLVNGRLNNDYKKLMETVENIESSSLYYKAAKLQQLARLK